MAKHVRELELCGQRRQERCRRRTCASCSRTLQPAGARRQRRASSPTRSRSSRRACSCRARCRCSDRARPRTLARLPPPRGGRAPKTAAADYGGAPRSTRRRKPAQASPRAGAHVHARHPLSHTYPARWQAAAASAPRYAGVADAMVKIASQEGVASLQKGLVCMRVR